MKRLDRETTRTIAGWVAYGLLIYLFVVLMVLGVLVGAEVLSDDTSATQSDPRGCWSPSHLRYVPCS